MEGRKLRIAAGRSCDSRVWVNSEVGWDWLRRRLSRPERTEETAEEYRRMGGREKRKAKDRGGFVGGSLRGGVRKSSAVECRSMLTLDLDRAERAFIDGFGESFPYAAALYSTHGHTPEAPRVRVIVPLSRDVTAEEHEALSRLVASDMGIGMADPCSFRAAQLMYWPSCPDDGEFVYREAGKAWLDPDAYLGAHLGWEDAASLPRAEREAAPRDRQGRMPGDPREKPGVIGAFCRAYTVPEAIEAFLSDVYEPEEREGRWHYIPAASRNGLAVYSDHGAPLLAWSNHASDPAYGRCLNAYDLVRTHMFGSLDEGSSPSTPVNRLPSSRAMAEFAEADPACAAELGKARLAEALGDFGGGGAGEDAGDGADGGWRSGLRTEKAGKRTRIADTVPNLILIFRNDPGLGGIARDTFSNDITVVSPVPWGRPMPGWDEFDDASLYSYLSNAYGRDFTRWKADTALRKVAAERETHPVREYFRSLPPWDGVTRAETLLVDTLGAEDTPYVRAVTRKFLCAAVRRVWHPGAKFDTMLVLVGPQGIGKSTLLSKLGGEWFTDSLSFSDLRYEKAAQEKLKGKLIVEIGELGGLREADVDRMKSFVSTVNDEYREAFKRAAAPHPRQCVIAGTTNAMDGFLRDKSGNRRFWPVQVAGREGHEPWRLTEEDVGMIWAEAVALEAAGEDLYLTGDLDKAARRAQAGSLDTPDIVDDIRDYLSVPRPLEWDSWTLDERLGYLESAMRPGFTPPEGSRAPAAVCNRELLHECLGYGLDDRIGRRETNSVELAMEKLGGWSSLAEGIRLMRPPYRRQRCYRRLGCDGLPIPLPEDSGQCLPVPLEDPEEDIPF